MITSEEPALVIARSRGWVLRDDMMWGHHAVPNPVAGAEIRERYSNLGILMGLVYEMANDVSNECWFIMDLAGYNSGPEGYGEVYNYHEIRWGFHSKWYAIEIKKIEFLDSYLQ